MAGESFRAALAEFTCVAPGSRRLSGSPEPARLCFLPVIGAVAVGLTLSVYLPLAAFYVPADVAGIIALITVGSLRGFKAEAEFGRLADFAFGARSRLAGGTVVAAPGVCLLACAFVFRYEVLRIFLLPDGARLLAFGTLASFVAPALVPNTGSRAARLLAAATLALASVACVKTGRFSAGTFASIRGPLLCFMTVYLCVRLVSRLAAGDAVNRPNLVALPSELAGYFFFLVVRYQFW